MPRKSKLREVNKEIVSDSVVVESIQVTVDKKSTMELVAFVPDLKQFVFSLLDD